jgi:hypothetical protein
VLTFLRLCLNYHSQSLLTFVVLTRPDLHWQQAVEVVLLVEQWLLL